MQITRKTLNLAKITFVLYMLLIFWVISLKCNMPVPISDTKAINRGLDIFERFMTYLPRDSFALSPTDATVNALLFVPIGMLLPFLYKRHIYVRSALACMLISAALEIFQIISCIGMFTYSDIIANTLGGVIGALVHFFLRKIAKEKPLAVTFYIIISASVITLIYAVVNTAVNIELYF